LGIKLIFAKFISMKEVKIEQRAYGWVALDDEGYIVSGQPFRTYEDIEQWLIINNFTIK